MTLLVISTIKCDKPTAGPVYSYYAPHPTAATVATTTTIPPPPPGECAYLVSFRFLTSEIFKKSSFNLEI